MAYEHLYPRANPLPVMPRVWMGMGGGVYNPRPPVRQYWYQDPDVKQEIKVPDTQSGFPKDNIENLSFDKLDCICSICAEVVRDPVAVECGHTFCTSCIKLALNSNPRCPSCMKSVSPGTTPVFCLKKYIDTFTIRCPEKSSDNPLAICKWKGTIESFRQHEKDCEYSSLPFNCLQCRESVPRKSVEKHKSEQCIYRHVPCGYCSSKIVCYNLEDHLLFDCMKRPFECRKCSKIIVFDDRSKHERDECTERYMLCNYCDDSWPSQYFGTHLKECPSSPEKMRILLETQKIIHAFPVQSAVSTRQTACILCDKMIPVSAMKQHCIDLHGDSCDKKEKKAKRKEKKKTYDR